MQAEIEINFSLPGRWDGPWTWRHTLPQEPAQRTRTLIKGSASLDKERVWTLKDTAAFSPALQGK